MRPRRAAAALAVAALALAGCGADEHGGGTARLWVTRDRGAHVMLSTTVPAGQTLIRALRSRARVKTRYGGRFVQAIDGVEGSLGKRHDWFWFVNGLAGDRSADEYRLHAGDVAWWDYRDWTHDADLAVVVGAFPEPFVHGYGGKTRPAAVVVTRRVEASNLAAVARLIHAKGTFRRVAAVPRSWNILELVPGTTRFTASQRLTGGPSSPIVFTFAGDVGKLLARAYARRFAVP
jgi:Domain of unknown function (DUF4430)